MGNHLQRHHESEEAEAWPALAKQTLADKALRFGCGAVPGVLVASVVVSVLDLVDLRIVVGFVLAFGAVCGSLAVVYGDRVIKELLKAIDWIA
jgi:hypothetical protein